MDSGSIFILVREDVDHVEDAFLDKNRLSGSTETLQCRTFEDSCFPLTSEF